jgi:hypothetical protein
MCRKAKLGKTAGAFNILQREEEKKRRALEREKQTQALIKPALLYDNQTVQPDHRHLLEQPSHENSAI